MRIYHLTQKGYTEEEFKQLLRTLFLEKKRVAELEKQLENEPLKKKFNAKLEVLALEDELKKVKATCDETQERNQLLQEQLEKAKEAVKKLVPELNEARHQIDHLKEQVEKNNSLAKELQENKELLNQEKKRSGEQEEALRELQAQLAKMSAEQGYDHFYHMERVQEEKHNREVATLVEEKELQLQKGYALQYKLKEFSTKLQESDFEVRRAQTHLAKKVKEAALLHDLAERQKRQILELQDRCAAKQQLLIEQEQKLEEQKVAEALRLERAQEAISEWETKCALLESELQKRHEYFEKLAKLVSDGHFRA